MKRLSALYSALVVAIIAVVAVSSCWHAPYAVIPKRLVLDVRPVQAVVLSDSARQEIFGVLDSLRRFPGVEHAGCYYGGEIKVGSHTLLEVAHATPPLPSDSIATPEKIWFACPFTSHGLPLIGDFHTHPTVSEQGELCFPSQVDMTSFANAENALILDIFCQNGFAYRELNDGRWKVYRWYQLSPTPPDGTTVNPT